MEHFGVPPGVVPHRRMDSTKDLGSIEISHARLPIIETRFTGLSTTPEFRAHLAEYVRITSFYNKPVVLLVDFRPADSIRIGPARIQLIAKAVEKIHPVLSPFVAAEARVFRSPAHRAISSTVVRMAGLCPWPIRSFERVAPAEAWLMKMLREPT